MARLEPTQILVKDKCKLVEKLQMRPLIGKELKYQGVLDPISYKKRSL